MESLAHEASVIECPACGQVLLATSWHENGGCTTYGCEGAPDFRKDVG
jgi:ssDNA-binding Zn-finger/Zn-ribbon topoisomerase 1